MTDGPDAGRVVVYTCVTGGYDIPLESPWALRCPHVCFTDDPRLRSATWSLRALDGADLDPARRSRLPKILPHRYLGDYDTSIWVDASARLLEDPVALARRALEGFDFAAPRHPKRDCAYLEVDECVRKAKEAESDLRRQAQAYRELGLPDHAGLWEATVLVRRHGAPAVAAAMEDWWTEVRTRSRRDQVSLAFVAWRHGLAIRSLPSRLDREAPYRIRKHHRDRTAMDRAGIEIAEWGRRIRTRVMRSLAAAPREGR